MRVFCIALLFCLASSSALAQTGDATREPDPAKKTLTVDVSCGKCKLGLPGNSCDLAVRIDGKSYYADGANIDDFGDAHAKDGMCNSIRQATVQGEVEGDRFKVSYIKLLPNTKTKKRGKQ